MKRIISTTCLLLSLLMTSVSQAGVVDKKDQNTLVKKLHQSYQGIRYFQSNFKQIKSVKFLTKPIISTGKMVFSPELGLVWEVTSPIWVKTLINDEGVFKTNARHKKQKVKDPQIKVVSSILTELLSSQLDQVESQFNISDAIDHTESGQWSVTLVAKGLLIKKAISSITIHGQLSTTGAEKGIDSLLIVDAAGNETKVLLSQQVLSQSELTDQQQHAFD